MRVAEMILKFCIEYRLYWVFEYVLNGTTFGKQEVISSLKHRIIYIPFFILTRGGASF